MLILKTVFLNPFSYAAFLVSLILLDLSNRTTTFNRTFEALTCMLYFTLIGMFLFFEISHKDNAIYKPNCFELLIYYAFVFMMAECAPGREFAFSYSTWEVLYIQMSIFVTGHYFYLLYKYQ